MRKALLEKAIHRFFKTLSLYYGDEYAVMLGGSLLPSKLNHKLLIGLRPGNIIKVQADKLTHETRNHTGLTQQTLCLSSPADLFQYLRQQSFSEKAFIQLGYEFYRYCDPSLWPMAFKKNETATSETDFLLLQFDVVGCFDFESQSWQWETSAKKEQQNCRDLWQDVLQNTLKTSFGNATELPIQNNLSANDLFSDLLSTYRQTFHASFSPSEFSSATQAILEHIEKGNVYQANLSLRLEKEVGIACPYAFYETLCQNSPAPFSAFVKTPEGVLVSNSPERLMSARAVGQAQRILLTTRPIAGTRGRGKTMEEDTALAKSLLDNPKERAEHLMLVDLLRNDLGHVCLAGSVDVDELLTIERYSHVMHLVSNIEGILDEARFDLWDAIAAVFPGGTITGCPKLRCIDILDSLEPVRREFYTGSLGYVDFNTPEMLLDLNILIRTLLLMPMHPPAATPAFLPYNASSDDLQGDVRSNHHTRYLARLHVGAGIVADSIAQNEYNECCRKAKALLGALYAAEHDPR